MLLPRTIKKLLGVFRGKVTPGFIFLSTMLGFCFGLVPGFSGLHIAILAAVLILNVNIGLFLFTGAFAKGLCITAAPALYYTGVWVHQHMPGLLRLFSRLPIIGATNFDRYAVTGALVIGPIVGSVAGIVLVWLVIRFRRKMVAFERNSPAFKKWYSKRWVRILDRVLIGKRAADMESMFATKKKRIRKPGLALVIIVFVIVSVVLPLLGDGLIREHAENAMSRANGAEVNIGRLTIQPVTGKVSMSSLQITDPEDPRQNRAIVENATAQAGVFTLLRGDFVLRNVEFSSVQFDIQRAEPGRLYEKPPRAEPEQTDSQAKPLGDYIADAQKLYDWFETISNWLPERSAEKEAPREIPERYAQYLTATAAVPASPRVLVRRADVQGLGLPETLFGTSTIMLANASDAPQAARLPVELVLQSQVSDAAVEAVWDYSVSQNAPAIQGNFRSIPLAGLTEAVGSIAGLQFEQGMATGQFQGQLTRDYTDLRINVRLSELQASGTGSGIFGMGAEQTSEVFSVIDEIDLVIHIVGRTKRPSVSIEAEHLMEQIQTALEQAGRQQLLRRIEDNLPEQLRDIEQTDEIIEGFQGIFNR